MVSRIDIIAVLVNVAVWHDDDQCYPTRGILCQTLPAGAPAGGECVARDAFATLAGSLRERSRFEVRVRHACRIRHVLAETNEAAVTCAARGASETISIWADRTELHEPYGFVASR